MTAQERGPSLKDTLTKALLEGCAGAREVSPSEVTWESSRWRTTVRIAPEGKSGFERARIWSEPVSGKWPFKPEHLPALNAMASMGGLVPSEDGRAMRLFSAVPIQHKDEEIAEMLGHVAITAAVLQPLWLDGMLRKVAEAEHPGRLHELLGPRAEIQMPPEADEPSAWDDTDFEGLAAELTGVGMVATGDATGLTAEVPLDEDAVSAVFGDSTALVRLASDTPHPFMGNGLFCSLHLPLPGGAPALRDAVASLSRAEMRDSRAPLLGAWCEDVIGPDSVAFVSFFPNMVGHDLLAPAAISWLATRARRAAGILAGGAD